MRTPVGRELHAAGEARLRESYAALPSGAPVRLAKRTSNLFRGRSALGAGLDVSGLTGVVEVDGDVAEVQGMCTYEHLVEVTLAHGRIPLVVPQLRTITLGGAVSGLGIESTSFRSGLPHESVLEMDVLTGAGEVVTTKPGDELFDAFPNSYGSLGYATRLRIELEQVPSYVAFGIVGFAGGWLFELFKAQTEVTDESVRALTEVQRSVEQLTRRLTYQDEALTMLSSSPRHNEVLTALIKASLWDSFRSIPYVGVPAYLKLLGLAISSV